MPQVNPTTPPRRQREPSPSTPGDNKRQSLRLKAGQQALAGLPCSHFPQTILRSGHQHSRLAGRSNFGVKLFPFSHGHAIAWRSRLRQGYVPPDSLQTAPPQGGVGSPHLDGWPCGLGHCPKQQRWGPRSVSSRRHGGTNSRSRSRWGTGHTPSRIMLEDIREILAPGAGRPGEGQPFFLDILHSLALNIQDPDHQFPRDLKGSHLRGVTDPPLASPRIAPEFRTPSSHGPG